MVTEFAAVQFSAAVRSHVTEHEALWLAAFELYHGSCSQYPPEPVLVQVLVERKTEPRTSEIIKVWFWQTHVKMLQGQIHILRGPGTHTCSIGSSCQVNNRLSNSSDHWIHPVPWFQLLHVFYICCSDKTTLGKEHLSEGLGSLRGPLGAQGSWLLCFQHRSV